MISVTFTGRDALRVLELLRADDERRARGGSAKAVRPSQAPQSVAEIQAAVLRILPCPDDELYERAGIPHPWRRAGNVIRGLRERGVIRREDRCYVRVEQAPRAKIEGRS